MLFRLSLNVLSLRNMGMKLLSWRFPADVPMSLKYMLYMQIILKCKSCALFHAHLDLERDAGIRHDLKEDLQTD